MLWTVSIVLVLVLFLYLSRRMDGRYRTAAAVALLGHVFVAIVVLPRVPYGWDIAKFHESATLILSGQTPQYAAPVTSFSSFQSLVYAATGPDTRALSIVNGLIAVLIPVPVRYLIRRLYPGTTDLTVATLLVLFLPLPFIMLTVPMRDALTILAFLSLICLIVYALTEPSIWLATVIPPLWGMVYQIRPELALLALVGTAAGLVVFVVDNFFERQVTLPWIVAAGIPAALVGFQLFTRRFPLATLNNKVAYRASGSAAYLESFQYRSWSDVILAAPGRAIYFQFAPFPLHVEQVFHAVALASLPVIAALSVFALYSMVHYRTNRIALVFLLAVYVTGIVGYGLIDSNFGTTARHRMPFVFLLVVFSGPVLARIDLQYRGWKHLVGQPGQNEEHDCEAQERDDVAHT